MFNQGLKIIKLKKSLKTFKLKLYYKKKNWTSKLNKRKKFLDY